jgi:hypothetical protein
MNVSTEESDRAIRLARIVAQANAAFGSSAKAINWLRNPQNRFADRSALEMANTEHGARLVETRGSNRRRVLRLMVLWRISNFAGLKGIGGLRALGRWHFAGRPVVYLAEHPAGALLETLVHQEIRWPPTCRTAIVY